MKKKKIMAVASIGGHWIQLLRITRSLEKDYEVVYLCTHPKCKIMVGEQKFYLIKNYSRWDAWKAIPSFFQLLWIIGKEKPTAIITTGAAPGLICLMAGKILGRKTIWVESLANVKHLSASGKIAAMFVSKIYTQWQALATSRIAFAGNTIG